VARHLPPVASRPGHRRLHPPPLPLPSRLGPLKERKLPICLDRYPFTSNRSFFEETERGQIQIRQGCREDIRQISRRAAGASRDQKLTDHNNAPKARGVASFVFGDIFLEDLKRWREENLARLGLRGLFPIWKRDSRELIREFIALGFGSIVCCVNDAYLDQTALGRKIDAEFINSLPSDVDPCGENGEFHSFAFAGPIFKKPLPIKVGEKVYRPVEDTHPGSVAPSPACPPPGARTTKGFWFCDLLPA